MDCTPSLSFGKRPVLLERGFALVMLYKLREVGDCGGK